MLEQIQYVFFEVLGLFQQNPGIAMCGSCRLIAFESKSVCANLWKNTIHSTSTAEGLVTLADPQEPSPLSAPGSIYPRWPVMDAAQEAMKLRTEDISADDALEVGHRLVWVARSLQEFRMDL